MGRDRVDDSSDEFIRLDGAQRRTRDTFFEKDSGLLIQVSDPGSGKSTTMEFVTAEFLAWAHQNDINAPEELVAVVSFTRDDAAGITPGVADALETLARDPDSGVDLSLAEAQELGRRVQRASTIGTVDSILQSLFASLALEVGFTEQPRVGETADLRGIRAACLSRLRRDDQYADCLDRLTTAYPGDGTHLDDAGALLRQAQQACRERQLSVEEFRGRLQVIIDETYLSGSPDSFADICAAVETFVNSETASAYRDLVDVDEENRTVAADSALHDAWQTAVDDLCTLLDGYIDAYDELTRERAVASHLDAAHWVTQFFKEDEYAGEFRDRLSARYTDRLEVVIIDEAQDVSTVQSVGLSALVDDETRVLLVADQKQLIYLWRNAQPELFQRAVEDGEYFGIDWNRPNVESEHRTRRCRPGITSAINTIFDAVFTDPARGADGTVSDTYAPLEPTRANTPHPNVHIAPVTTSDSPGGPGYVVAKRDGRGEAAALAHCIATGREQGMFIDEDDGEATVTVLFARRTNIESFRTAFERMGLSVGDATAPLFAQPLIKAVVEICTALTRPDVGVALERRITESKAEESTTESVLAESDLDGVFSVFGRDVRTIAEERPPDKPALAFIHGLDHLTRQRERLQTMPLSTGIETVIDELELWTDPLALSDDPARRVDALDALLMYVEEIEKRSDTDFDDLVSALERLYREPNRGPNLPLADESTYDVVFKTAFQMKGEEDSVIALGDIGAHIGKMGPHKDTFCAQGSTVALAPPGGAEAAATPALPGFKHGVFDVDRKPWDYDAGLRWITQRWADDNRLAGPPVLSAIAHAHRAGRWRLLYVAMSRARNHLVIPLPRQRADSEPRDYWVDTLREALEFDETKSGTYLCDAPTGEHFQVRVADAEAELDDSNVSVPTSEPPAAAAMSVASRPTWTPRFGNPSTMYPLLAAPETQILDHLQGRALHTQHDGVDENLSLTFETLGPEEVGDVGHEVIATAIRHRDKIDCETLRACGGVLDATLQYELDGLENQSGVSESERARLKSFIRERVCPQLAASDVWMRVQDAAEVYVEEPVDMIVRIDGLDTELQSLVDVVTKDAAGDWHTDELKIVLQQSDTETRARYELQAQFYAWGLSKQLNERTEVYSHITQLGAEPMSISVDWGEPSLMDRLKELRALF